MAKFFLISIGVYLFYRYVLRSPRALPPKPSEDEATFGGRSTQEPDLFIEHEEVKKEHETNK